MAIDVKYHKRRLDAAKAERQPHEPGWSECFDYTYPERGNGLNSSTLLPQELQSKRNRILDDTAADSARILASAIVTGTTPANSLWFNLSASGRGDQDVLDAAYDEEARFFEDAARIMFANIHGSNFDALAYEGAIDLTIAGVFSLFIDEAAGGGYHFELWPIAQCYVATSTPDGPIDTIYRETEYTNEQLVSEYGLDACPDVVRSEYQAGKLDTKHALVHAIYPRKDFMAGARRAVNLPFASAHFMPQYDHPLRESGYHEFPVVYPRWLRTPGSVYATGVCAKALGSIRTINDAQKLELLNLEMAVGGQYVAVDDGVLNPSNIVLGARKVVVANDIGSIKELPRSGDFNIAFITEDRLQAQIRRTFMADQLQPQDGPAMTATEVHARVQMIRQLLGPIYARLRSEYLQKLIERCFGIAYRAGVLGQAPASLQNREYIVKFISPLARAQQLEDVTAMDRLEASLAGAAQIDPSVLDVYDFDKASKLRAEFLGTPKATIRSEAEILTLRRKRQQVQQAQQMQQLAQPALQEAGKAMGAKIMEKQS